MKGMIRKKCLLGLLMATVFLSGCGQKNASVIKKKKEHVVDKVIEEKDEKKKDDSEKKKDNLKDKQDLKNKTGNSDGDVDVDLTELNSNLVYSEVLNMLMDPDSYEGKIVRVSGEFSVFEAPPDNSQGVEHYYTVIISDAMACCQNGMEFVWTGEHKYPEDYPVVGSIVTVTGRFETYEDGGLKYCHIMTDGIEVNQG